MIRIKVHELSPEAYLAAKPDAGDLERALLDPTAVFETPVGASSLPAMLAGTVVLALAANAYELLCTAGFPLVFTRVLTLSELPTPAYYGYLALYNLVYVLPLLAIVTAFVITLGSRKLTEGEGRILKLLSGLMMLASASSCCWPRRRSPPL